VKNPVFSPSHENLQTVVLKAVGNVSGAVQNPPAEFIASHCL
jgi:hypothetical protein